MYRYIIYCIPDDLSNQRIGIICIRRSDLMCYMKNGNISKLFFKDNLPVIWTCHTSLLRHFGMSNLMWAVLIPGSLISIALTKCGKSQSWKYSNISYINSRFKYHKYSYKNSPKSIDKLYYINASVWLLGIIWLFGQNCINEKYIIFIKAVKATISSGLINFQVTDFYKKKLNMKSTLPQT